ncbi:MAG: protein-L-isoaspartate(D-aspartate) O-methyltransferase [Kiloniellaceae bacterium]
MRASDDIEFATERQAMVEIIAAYVFFSSDQTQRQKLDDRVMTALARVPRHKYVPLELQQVAYEDTPLPIGCGKTISQPFMVALMTDLLEIERDDTVLEIGTGLGYQAAILAELASQVYTVEIIEELATEGENRLRAAGYDNVHFRIGDGSHGWPEHAPYTKIVVTAAPELIPPMLLQQLKAGGKMVIPAGIEDRQQLLLVEKDARGRLSTREVIPVRFSPLIISH